MTYRTDKFEIGDKVTWVDEDFATLTDGREKYGDGPFTICAIDDRQYEPYYDTDDYGSDSNWDAMGHTQHVYTSEILYIDQNFKVKHRKFSGAFFKKVD